MLGRMRGKSALLRALLLGPVGLRDHRSQQYGAQSQVHEQPQSIFDD